MQRIQTEKIKSYEDTLAKLQKELEDLKRNKNMAIQFSSMNSSMQPSISSAMQSSTQRSMQRSEFYKTHSAGQINYGPSTSSQHNNLLHVGTNAARSGK